MHQKKFFEKKKLGLKKEMITINSFLYAASFKNRIVCIEIKKLPTSVVRQA